MALQSEYVSLEGFCTALKAQNLSMLSAIADRLESILDPCSVFNASTIYIQGVDPSGLEITYQDLADYLRRATGKYVPVFFNAGAQTFESVNVKISRDWIVAKVSEVEGRLSSSLSVESSMGARRAHLSNVVNASFALPYENQPKQMDANGHDHLLRKLAIQNDQRKAQEAASKDAVVRRDAEERALRAEAALAAKEEELRQQTEKNAEYERYRNADMRRIRVLQDELASLEEQLEDLTGLMVFCDPENPLSPPEGRLLVRCWMDITQNGTYDVVSESRVGMKEHARRWLRSVDGKEPTTTRLKIYSLLLTSAARKLGGVLASKPKKR